ncbi:serine protease filzig [Lutzomyia longipalpis]|uniref:serine protease filzig n=1 Tax=Lutzomyia longipalpis TaxID=7200 RepID=UPI002484273D|nr:serine protease filzig [Lutzomyia longipalpis]
MWFYKWILMTILLKNSINGLSTVSSDRESRKLFGGYRITPKFCKPSKSLPKDDIRAHGPTICMFNHECTQRQGQVVGACMDGFLFGTCCQLQGSVDSPLTPPTDELDDRPITNQAISQSYETYGNHILPGNAPYNEIKIQDRPATTPDSAQKFTSHYYVNNEAVVVSSPSSVHKASTYMPMTSSSTPPPQASTKIGDIYLPMDSSPSHYSSEIPTRLSSPFSSTEPTTQEYLSASQMNYVTNSLLDNNFNTHFTHSDITHPGADADLLGDDDAGYARPSDFTSAGTFISSPTPKPSTKNTPPKPEFKPKPKPTTASPNKYVLVHTISNDKPSAKPTIGENDIESIESIILMLNETNTGPQYNAASTPEDRETTFYTTRYPGYNYTDINTDKYGPTSFYVTTKFPTSTGKPNQAQKTKKPATKKPPSTSYVSSTVAVTPRPGATTTKKGTKRPSGGTKVTQKPPSTSYVYSSQPTKRPTSVTVSTSPQKFQTSPPPLLSSTTPTVIVLSPFDPSSSTLPPEQIIQSKPIEQEFYNEDDTGYGQVSVTQRPSPTVVITPKPALGSSPWPQQSRPTKPPSTSYVYSPVVTKRPIQQATPPYGPSSTFSSNYYRPQYEQTVSSTAIYTAEESDGIYNYIQTQTDYNNNAVYAGSTLPYPEISTIKEDYLTPQDDLVNFPPVRNPNLNTSLNYPGAEEEEEVVTPTFLEDQKFKDKMDLLVSKIVASLQSNFDSLADVVLERNTTNVIQKRPTAKPGVATSKPPTRKPTPKPPQRTTVPPLGVTSRRPPTKPAATGATRPGVTTRKPTARPGQITSSRPTRKPTTTLLTTRRPTQKVTTTVRPTTRPTKRIKTTTVLSTTNAEDYDTEDVGEEQDGETSTPVTDDDGRIRCGIRPHVKSARIVGGKSAHFGEFPWQVLVRESTWLGLFTKNKCGGVLISNSYVITAAHCQPGFLASLVAVFGEYDISGEVESKRSVTKNVKRVIVHRQYDAATFENDLAILELESPIHYDTHIVPVCMPPDNADFTGRMATVTGWGRLKYGGGVPSVLQEVHVPIIDNSVCQEMFQTAGHNKKILKSFLCAGYANGQKDSCEGDSGGPLVLQRPDGRWELAGTVSHGIKCAAPYLPGVYMRTTFYKPWLQSVTGVH